MTRANAMPDKEPTPTRRAARPRANQDIPTFSLYGEAGPATGAEFVHIEDIRSRSAPHDWEIDAHTHRGLFQIVAIAEGGAEVSLDGRALTAAPPVVVTLPPAAVHAFRFRRGTRGHVLTIAEALLFDAAGDAVAGMVQELFLEARVIALDEAAMRPVLLLLDQVAAEFRSEAPGRTALVEWLLRAALLHIARAHLAASRAHAGGRGPGHAARFAAFRTLVEARYREHWPLSRYCAALRLTEGQLNRLARRLGGHSAAELIQQRLFLEARRRLIHVAAPIARIAYDLGFQDPAYFCRIFKRRTGMTPSAFRRSHE